MTHLAALPFTFSRSHDVIGKKEITSTTERVDGLLLLSGDQLVIQWRLARNTDRVGQEIRTDRELEPIREVVIPISALAGAQVRWAWLAWPPGHRLVLTAADLRAFEQIAGTGGLSLDHPAELTVHVRRSDRLAAREFVSELELAVAEIALQAAEHPPQIEGKRGTGAIANKGVGERIL
jgi:hypothetical protein